MDRQNKLTTRGRFNALTRKQELAELRERSNADLAAQIAVLLEPFVKAEIERQMGEAVDAAFSTDAGKRLAEDDRRQDNA